MKISIHNVNNLNELVDYFKKFSNVLVDTSDINNIKIFIRKPTPRYFQVTIG